jgi:hypothetical protein
MHLACSSGRIEVAQRRHSNSRKGEKTVSSEFSTEVLTIVGPLLEGLGFILDGVDDSPDEGGRRQHIVFYRSNDCKIQIYESSREGEINCMIAPLEASNEFGLSAEKC